MKNLIKSKERVSKYGEVFTPQYIVQEMLGLVKDEWSDPKTIFLEPTCGNGNFIVEITQKRLDAGIKIFTVLNTIFGMDIMEDNIHECHRRIYEIVREYLKDVAVCNSSEKYKDTCIKVVAIVENNIYKVEDSLVELNRSNGDSKFDKKKFVFFDPTGNNMVLSENEKQKILDKIEKRWDLVKENFDKLFDININIQKLINDIDAIEKENSKIKNFVTGEDKFSQGEMIFNEGNTDPRIVKLNKQIQILHNEKSKIKNIDDDLSVFLDKSSI